MSDNGSYVSDGEEITFLYALEISGVFKDLIESQADNKTWQQLLCELCSFRSFNPNSNNTFEVKEYYASKTRQNSNELKWIANQKDSLLVHKSQSELHKTMFNLSLLHLVEMQWNQEKIKEHYELNGFELVYPVISHSGPVTQVATGAVRLETICIFKQHLQMHILPLI